MTASEPLLQLRGLSVVFDTRRGQLQALREVSFDMAPGEILGMVGESGAGKSLTGAALVGLLEPPGHVAAGEIRLGGVRLDGLDDAGWRRIRGREVGAIFQDPLSALNPLYTVGRQLTETLRTHRKMSARAAWDEAVALLRETGLPAPEQRMTQYPHELSGGMRQRVVIALALAPRPRLLIADEPTTALDVSIQAQIIALLRRVARDHGTAVMLITHDLGVVAETCDRVAVMYAGRLVEIGPVREVLHRPLHPYTRGLMGAIPVLGAARERLVQIEGQMPRLADMPTGCAFHPRCPHAMPRCTQEVPVLRGEGAHAAACWLNEAEVPA